MPTTTISTAANDAHEAVNNILAAKGYTVASTNGKMTADGDADLTYAWTEDKLDTTTYSVSENGTAITNQLSCADPNLYDGEDNTVTWLSRSDWNGTLPTETVKLAPDRAAEERPAGYPLRPRRLRGREPACHGQEQRRHPCMT